MALTFIQAAANNVISLGTSVAAAYSGSTTGSSYLLAWVLSNPTSVEVTSITDTLGNVWEQIHNDPSGNFTIFQVRVNKVSGGANTVTVNYSGGVTLGMLIIAEYTGQAASGAETVTVFQDATGTSVSGQPVTTALTNETVIAIGFWDAVGTPTAGAPFTKRLSTIVNGIGNYIQDAPAATPGVYTPTINNASSSRYVFNTLSVRSATSNGAQATPTFSPVAGGYGPTQNVTITSAGADTIYYTTDGSTPTTGSTVYSGPVAIASSSTLKALAVKTNWINSAIGSAAYVINGAQATPTFSPVAGSYGTTQFVAITSSGADTIYYTTDGSTPTTSSSVYSTPVAVARPLTLKALAVRASWSNSAIGSAAYTISGGKGVNSSAPTTAFVVGGVYNATPPTLTDGAAAALQFDVNGQLKTTGSGGGGTQDVNITEVAGSAIGITHPVPVELSDGTNPTGTPSNPLSVNVITGGGSNASVGATGATAPTSATEVGIIVGGNLVGVSSSNPVPVSVIGAIPAGSNVIGHVITDSGSVVNATLLAGSAIAGKFGIDQTTPGTTNGVQVVAALPAGANVIGHVIADTGSTTAVTGNVTVVQTTATNLHTAATLDAETTKVIGTVRNLGNAGAIFDGATAASVPANALYGGVRGSTALPTAVTDGQLVGGMADKYGRRVVVLNTVRDLAGRKTTQIVNSTAETTIATQVASTFLDITSLQITNASATVVSVTIKDSTAGTTVAIYDIAANGGISVQFPTPLTQTTVNNNWTATLSVNTVTVNISVQFVKNA